MTRAAMKLHLKKDQLHRDVGKAPGSEITEADIAKEKSKGGVFAKRAVFAIAQIASLCSAIVLMSARPPAMPGAH